MGYFKIIQYTGKQAEDIENKVKTTWLCRYPWPEVIIYLVRGNFLDVIFKTL